MAAPPRRRFTSRRGKGDGWAGQFCQDDAARPFLPPYGGRWCGCWSGWEGGCPSGFRAMLADPTGVG